MGDNNIPIGTIHGIKIRINWSWIIIFVLVMWSLAAGYFPDHFKGWSTAEYWLVSAAAALLLFLSVMVHELSHSFVAQARGIPVDSITLYIFGGVSNITKEPTSAGEEFAVAFAGPLSSIVIGLIFGALYAAVGSPDWLHAMFGYLGGINIVLALFNLIPAFPLDGGRVFRSIVWAMTHDMQRATRLSAVVGNVFAYLFIFVGVWLALTIDLIGGIWLAFIGWFLHNAATASYSHAVQTAAFRNVSAQDVMTSDPPTVGPETNLANVVHDFLLHQSQRAIPVVSNEHLLGLLTITDVRHFPSLEWGAILAQQAMTPVDRLDTVMPRTDLAEALDLMTRHGHNQLPVVEDGRLVGLVTRANILHYLQVRHELGVGGANRRPMVPGGDPDGISARPQSRE